MIYALHLLTLSLSLNMCACACVFGHFFICMSSACASRSEHRLLNHVTSISSMPVGQNFLCSIVAGVSLCLHIIPYINLAVLMFP